MRRRAELLLVILTGCSVVRSSGHDAAVADAPPQLDARIDESRMPFTTVGTTPAGPLDGIRFISITFLYGFCPRGYYLDLYATNVLSHQPLVHFHIPIAEPPAPPPIGTTPATAWPAGAYDLRTEAGSFEITQLDLLPTSPLRIAGRMLIKMGAWNVDFTVDALTDAHSCL